MVTNVAPVGLQRPAIAPPSASARAYWTDIFEIEIAGANEIAKEARGSTAKFSLGFAIRFPCFRGIEPHETNIRRSLIDADSVAIEDANVVGIDRRGNGQR